jgi:hypothetical protein
MARAATLGEQLAVAEATGKVITMDDLAVARMRIAMMLAADQRRRLQDGELIDWREGRA